MQMKIYYESDPIMGVNVIYDFNGQRHFDSFSSITWFYAWASVEFYLADLIEITDLNYKQLSDEGAI